MHSKEYLDGNSRCAAAFHTPPRENTGLVPPHRHGTLPQELDVEEEQHCLLEKGQGQGGCLGAEGWLYSAGTALARRECGLKTEHSVCKQLC